MLAVLALFTAASFGGSYHEYQADGWHCEPEEGIIICEKTGSFQKIEKTKKSIYFCSSRGAKECMVAYERWVSDSADFSRTLAAWTQGLTEATKSQDWESGSNEDGSYMYIAGNGREALLHIGERRIEAIIMNEGYQPPASGGDVAIHCSPDHLIENLEPYILKYKAAKKVMRLSGVQVAGEVLADRPDAVAVTSTRDGGIYRPESRTEIYLEGGIDDQAQSAANANRTSAIHQYQQVVEDIRRSPEYRCYVQTRGYSGASFNLVFKEVLREYRRN